MTPSMRLGELARRYRNSKVIIEHLNEAFALGHEFGLARATDMAKAINPFAFITKQLAALKVEFDGPQKTDVAKIKDDSSIQHYLSENGRFDVAVVDGVIVGITILT